MNYFTMDCACKGKNLDKMIQPVILKILYREPMHGFVIIQKLSESPMYGGTEPDHAGVYRYLKKMEESGLLTSEWDMAEDGGKPKRVYTITERGKHCLANWAVVLKDYAISVEKLADELSDTIV